MNTATRMAAALLLSVGFAVVTLLTTAPLAGADPAPPTSTALISSDGINFGPTVSGPLFTKEHALEPTAIPLAMQMADIGETSGQGETASFDVYVSMWDAAGPPPADSCGDGGVGILGVDPDTLTIALPDTGADSRATGPTAAEGPRALTPAAIAAVALGILLALLSSRRDRRRGTR